MKLQIQEELPGENKTWVVSIGKLRRVVFLGERIQR
jgi:hypothetical protein